MLNIIIGSQSFKNNAQWFQQNGATPHTAIQKIPLINEQFGDEITSRNSPAY